MSARYLEQFFALQPPGKALPRDPDTDWGRLLAALAEEPERVENRCAALVRESDPRLATELLPDWERVCGLPGPCPLAWDATLQARRAAVVAQLTGMGGQTKAFYRALADMLGLIIEITEYRPFITGLSRCGQRLNGPHSVRSVWRVLVRGQRHVRFRAGLSACGEKLLSFARREDLECLLRLYAPAHTVLIVGYEGVETARKA